jgi:hypothetical protein
MAILFRFAACLQELAESTQGGKDADRSFAITTLGGHAAIVWKTEAVYTARSLPYTCAGT